MPKPRGKGGNNPNWPRKGRPSDVQGQSQNKAGKHRGNNPPRNTKKK